MTADHVAVDNDVLLKLASYGLLNRLPEIMGIASRHIHVLRVARFVIPDAIRRRSTMRGCERVEASFADFIRAVDELEPSPSEINLATCIEELALIKGVNVDNGESQLCAIVLGRRIPLLLTGDKRAVVALEQLRSHQQAIVALDKRVGSFEQILLRALRHIHSEALRQIVCSAPEADRAAAICFSCTSPDAVTAPRDSLLSYIQDLRRYAPNIITDADELP